MQITLDISNAPDRSIELNKKRYEASLLHTAWLSWWRDKLGRNQVRIYVRLGGLDFMFIKLF